MSLIFHLFLIIKSKITGAIKAVWGLISVPTERETAERYGFIVNKQIDRTEEKAVSGRVCARNRPGSGKRLGQRVELAKTAGLKI